MPIPAIFARPFLLPFFGLLVALFLCGPAMAQPTEIKKTPYSETEKIGFAFYTLAKRHPPFESWIRVTDNYLLAKPSAKRGIMIAETERLSKAFGEYMLDDDLIFIRTNVRVKVPTTTEREAYDKMGVRKPVQILMDDVHENYFPVKIGEMWIAVVASQLEDFLFLSLTPEEYERLTKRLSLDARGTARHATLELRLRPVKVDLSRPMPLDGLEAWLMLSEIASISLWRKANGDKDAEVLWEQNMSWYKTREQKELLDLYTR